MRSSFCRKGQCFGLSLLWFCALACLLIEGMMHGSAFDFAGAGLIPGLKGGGIDEAARVRAQSRTSWRGDSLALF